MFLSNYPFRTGVGYACLLSVSIILSLTSLSFGQDQAPAKQIGIYEAIGVMFAQGSGLGRMDFTEEELEKILVGIRKGITLKEIPPEVRKLEPEIDKIMRAKMALARQAQQAQTSKSAGANKAKGKAFLAELSKKPGVLKDPSGFYYEILKQGDGPSPTMVNTVRLHYHGTLIDGTVFDSSVQRGQPASFRMNGVIKGFSGGLTKCKAGGKIRIYIPSELGYGDNPRPGGKIKPGDTLIFECTLLEVK